MLGIGPDFDASARNAEAANGLPGEGASADEAAALSERTFLAAACHTAARNGRE